MQDHKLIASYLRKCFFSVDGLWFLKTEEDSSFEKALETDSAVWEVLPKIQARTIKKLLGLGGGIDCLHRALDFKLSAEDFDYRIDPVRNGGFTLSIASCPWVSLIAGAGRKHLVEQISDAICPIEFKFFSREFDPDIAFSREHKGCLGTGPCRMAFRSVMRTKRPEA